MGREIEAAKMAALHEDVYSFITKTAAEQLGINYEDAFVVKRRYKSPLFLRFAVIYVLRRVYRLQYEAIGILLGQDHATIMNAVDKIHWLSMAYVEYRRISKVVKDIARINIQQDDVIEKLRTITKYRRGLVDETRLNKFLSEKQKRSLK